MIESGATLFVSAVGVPQPWVIEKLHKANILVMNMVGHPKHVHKACAAGVDIICAQGGEAGGHTGDIPTMVSLITKILSCHAYEDLLIFGFSGSHSGLRRYLHEIHLSVDKEASDPGGGRWN